MNSSFLRLPILISIAALCSVPLSAQPIGAEAEFSGEVLTRGPVHEAFAAVVTYNPEAGLIVDREPPEPVEELPPQERPVDADTAWIPGYWGWDDERNDFIWISGTWRTLPPGRAWIAGYWRDTGRGWQWVSGYWEDAGRREVVYLAPPPETLERGPSSPQPTPNHEWVSGHWEWMDGRYLWRAGYWIEGRTDWVWVPSYYVWTPRGYVFVEGYWDYAPVGRGLLFAPVYYREYRPGYRYRPNIVLNVAILSDYLFLRPRYSHYYFGDYYDPRYESSGFFATFTFHTSRRGYDPFYTYSRWRHRDERDWERRYRTAYEYRRTHEDARPPRRWTGSTMTVNVNQNITNITQVGGAGGRQTVTYAQPIEQYARASDMPVRVERVASASMEQQVQLARQVQEQRVQRRTMESQEAAVSSAPVSRQQSGRAIGGAQRGRAAPAQEVSRAALPASPIVARESTPGRPPPPRAPESARGRAQGGPSRRAESPVPNEARSGPQTGAPEQRNQRDVGQESVIGATPAPAPRDESVRRRDERGLRADNSAAVEARRLEEQARREEQQQAGDARRSAPSPGQTGTQPEQQSQRALAQPNGEQGDQQRRAAEAQERAYNQQPPQVGRESPEQERREDEQRRAQPQQQQRLEQQQARQQEADARQQQRESEFQAREQQGRAAEQAQAQERQARAAEQAQVREQQSRAANEARQRQAQADQQRAQQSQAAEQARARQSQSAEQAREQQGRAAQQAEPARQNASPNRDQNQPPPRKKSKEQLEEEERQKRKGGGG